MAKCSVWLQGGPPFSLILLSFGLAWASSAVPGDAIGSDRRRIRVGFLVSSLFVITTPVQGPVATNATPCAVNVWVSLRRVESPTSMVPFSMALIAPTRYRRRRRGLDATNRGDHARHEFAGRTAFCSYEVDCCPNWLASWLVWRVASSELGRIDPSTSVNHPHIKTSPRCSWMNRSSVSSASLETVVCDFT